VKPKSLTDKCTVQEFSAQKNLVESEILFIRYPFEKLEFSFVLLKSSRMSAYDNVFQRPTSLFFASSNKFHHNNNNMNGMLSSSSPVNGGGVGGVGGNGHSNMMIGAASLLSNGGGVNNLMNDVFADEQEDQIVPDCSVAPKLDLSPMNEPWVSGVVSSDSNCGSHGFLTTAVHLSLQEVSPII
jgi:hypothetical protein